MSNGIILMKKNEDGMYDIYEPYCTVDFQTKEDYEHFEQILEDHNKYRWIPVSKRLPEDGQKVLCTHLGGLNPNLQVIEHEYIKGNFVFNWSIDDDFESPTFGQLYMGEVIAWKPLPEPYKAQ